MNRRTFVTRSLAAAAAATLPASLRAAAGSPGRSPAALVPIRVSPRDPRYLEHADGRPFIPIGLNLCFPRFVGTRAEGLALYERWLTQLATHGGNFLRLWLGHSFFDPEPETAGRFDEERTERIAAVLDRAQALGLRVKLTLEHFRSIDPQPVAEKFPGAASFAKPVYHLARGGFARDMADFLENPACRRRYLGKLDWLAARFGRHPAICAWELWNEMNAVRGGDWLAWTRAMLPELRARFPHALPLQSLGSFDAVARRRPYADYAALADHAVVQVHRYFDPGAELACCREGPVDVLSADAIAEMRRLAPSKPLLLAEGGAVEAKHAGPWKPYAADTEGLVLHDVLFAPFFAGAAGSGQIWHWDFYVDQNNLWHHFARFAAAVGDLDPPAERFEPVAWETPRLRVYALRGRHTLVAWCREKNPEWQADLVARRGPRAIVEEMFDLRRVDWPDSARTARLYDPWTDRWTATAVQGAALALPEFRRSLVLRLGRRFVPARFRIRPR